MKTRWNRIAVCGALAIVILPGLALGQCSGSSAISLFFDPSTRSLGMGGASGPVFWGGDPNDWANPALLGYHQGIRFRYDKARLVPDLAADVFWSSTRISMGAYGLGLSFAGMPDHLGGARLDYGTSLAVDSGGQILGSFDSWEEVDSFGLGINVLELAESLLGHWSEAPGLNRWGDVSIGWARKTVDVNLAPAAFLSGGLARDGAQTNDIGFLLRFRPFDSIEREGSGPRLESLGGWRLDLAYAMSWRNYEDASLTFLEAAPPDPIGRDERIGIAVHAATGLPPDWRDRFEAKELGWLAEAFSPFLELGFAWDRSNITLPGGSERSDCSTENLYGLELVVAKVVSLRWGYGDGDSTHGSNWGLGLGFSLGDIAGVRYDHATIAQAEGLQRKRMQGVSVYFDGVALARRLRAP